MVKTNSDMFNILHISSDNLTKLYFSNDNMELLQDEIRMYVNYHTDISIGKQSYDDLKIIMMANYKDKKLSWNLKDKKYTKIQSIPFDQTIDVFQSNNSVILIFKYKAGKESSSKPTSEDKKTSKNKTHKQVRFNLKQSNKTLKKTT